MPGSEKQKPSQNPSVSRLTGQKSIMGPTQMQGRLKTPVFLAGLLACSSLQNQDSFTTEKGKALWGGGHEQSLPQGDSAEFLQSP